MQRSTVLRSRCRSPSKDTGRPPALPRFLWSWLNRSSPTNSTGNCAPSPRTATVHGEEPSVGLSSRPSYCRMTRHQGLRELQGAIQVAGAAIRFAIGSQIARRDGSCGHYGRAAMGCRTGTESGAGCWLGTSCSRPAGRTPPRSSARTWRRSLQLARETRARARRRDRRVHDHPVSEREGAGFPRGRWQKAPDQSLHPRPKIHFRALNQNPDFSVLRQSAAPGRNGGPHHASAGAGRRTPHGSGEPVVHP